MHFEELSAADHSYFGFGVLSGHAKSCPRTVALKVLHPFHGLEKQEKMLRENFKGSFLDILLSTAP